MATQGTSIEEYMHTEWIKQVFNLALNKHINEEKIIKEIFDRDNFKIEWSYDIKLENDQKYETIMDRFKQIVHMKLNGWIKWQTGYRFNGYSKKEKVKKRICPTHQTIIT